MRVESKSDHALEMGPGVESEVEPSRGKTDVRESVGVAFDRAFLTCTQHAAK